MAKVANRSGWFLATTIIWLFITSFLLFLIKNKTNISFHEELIEITESERQLLINQANEYMNSKQWPGKAAIGRLKDEELALYNLWLDYLDALELVDTSSAPDIEWPTPPVTQAS